ncbi:hypothetical protein CUMW_123640 [Citrus unshiu]|nr:hypothetical protein CUMW_123640 [Citrus unshiu]
MGIFEEMGFCGNLEFFSALPGEGEAVMGHEMETAVEEDCSDEEVDVDELERRMWRDRLLLKRLKEQNKSKEGVDSAKHRQSQEQARRKKMSRAQDGILKYMLKMMEVCKAQGFVYGIIPEKGKPVTGASDNLRAWWKEKVRFDRVDNERNVEVEEIKPLEANLFNMGAMGSRDRFMMPPSLVPRIKGEVFETHSESIQKRRPSADEPHMTMDQKIYTCEFPQCPYNDYHHGFLDRTSRNNHQLNCPYRNNGSQGCVMPNFQINNDQPAVFSLPFAQSTHPKPITSVKNQTQPQYNVSGLGLPDDGQKMISDLMSFYDTNLQPNKSMSQGCLNITEDRNQQPEQQKFQLQLDDSFYNQGIDYCGILANSKVQLLLQSKLGVDTLKQVAVGVI